MAEEKKCRYSVHAPAKWEYKIHVLEYEDTEKLDHAEDHHLNALGGDGWILIDRTEVPPEEGMVAYRYIMCRPKEMDCEA